jgi:hypothetical protein
MSNCVRRDEATPENEYTILLCHAANEVTRQFYSDLSSIDQNSADWEYFIKSKLDSGNGFEKLSCLKEIGKSGNPEWLEFLFLCSEQEAFASSLVDVYWAISTLGGFPSVSDVEKLFDTPDSCRRCAAMAVLDSMASKDAIPILRKILKHDPDVSTRRAAALRLAYHNSSDGLQELLDILDKEQFFQRVRAACALCALGNPAGIDFIRLLLRSNADLSKQERTNLVYSLPRLLTHVGVEWYQSGAEPEVAARLILDNALKWIETRGSETMTDEN